MAHLIPSDFHGLCDQFQLRLVTVGAGAITTSLDSLSGATVAL